MIWMLEVVKVAGLLLAAFALVFVVSLWWMGEGRSNDE